MGDTTGGVAVAERPDELWLAAMPTAFPKAAAQPAVRSFAATHRLRRPATGVLAGLPGAVTDLALSADGRRLITAHGAADAISVINTETLTVTATATGIAEPDAVTVTDRAYVRSASLSEDCVVAVELESGAELARCALGDGVRALVASPAGDRIYVARMNLGQSDFAVVEIESGAVSVLPVPVPVGASIDAMRMNHVGTRLYAGLTTSTGGGLLLVIDVSAARVRTVSVGGSISDIAIDRAERWVVLAGSDARRPGLVRIVDLATPRRAMTVPLAAQPVGLALAGDCVYVGEEDEVVAIDATTGRVVSRTDLGRAVSGLAVSRDGSRLYAGDFDGRVTALPVRAAGMGLRPAS